MCASSVPCGLLRGVGPLEIDLQAAVSHHVHAGNQTWISGKAVSAPTSKRLKLGAPFLFILGFLFCFVFRTGFLCVALFVLELSL